MVGQVYTSCLQNHAHTASDAVFYVVAPADSRVRIREIRLGQYTDFGDAAAEILNIRLLRSSSSLATAGGTALGPLNVKPWARAAGAIVTSGPTAQATAGSECVVADTMNIAAGWWYYPPDCEKISVEAGGSFAVWVTDPADSLTLNGTIVFEETGGNY